MILRKFLNCLGPFKWTVHNIIAHPIAEIFWLLRLEAVGSYVHDVTIPYTEN